MSNRLFQGVIHQMRDAIDRTVGVIDESGTVISCSELERIGEQNKTLITDIFNSNDPIILDGTTYLSFDSRMRHEYAIFVDGEDELAEKYARILSVSFGSIKQFYDEKYDRSNFVKNVILDAVGISSGTNVGSIANEAIGTSANKASIYNCGVLSGSISGSGYVGSIVGKLGDDSNNDNSYARVINCYSYATIGGGSSVGGIVGYNSFASAANNLRTMVMNCMYYGKITGGSNKAPIYNGQNITNVGANGLANYNYYFSGCTFTGGIDTYNCALAADERYLTRFEFYRQY